MLPLFLAVALAGVAQGMTGFGFGIVAMAGLTPILGPVQANLIVTPLAGANILISLWGVRHAVEWRRALPLWLGGILGVPVGVWVLTHAHPVLLRQMIGAIILFTAFISLRGTPEKPTTPRQHWGLAAGILGGVMSGAVAMAGPPAVLYTYRQPWPLARIKATLLLFFAWTVTYKLTILAHTGVYTLSIGRTILILVPLVVITSWAGHVLSERLPRRKVNLAVALLLFLSGLALLVPPS